MVPAAIDHIMFFRHTWMRMVNATEMTCAQASLPMVKLPLPMEIVVRRQYTTRSAKTDAGNTLPKYRMYFGVGLPGRKAMKGMKRVSIVAATPAATMMICWVILIVCLLSVRCLLVLYVRVS